MKTVYHVSWEVRKTNGVKTSYASKMFDTEAEARALFEQKAAKSSTTYAHLWRNEDYYKETELPPFDPKCNRTPWGWRHFDCLASYDPMRFKGIKVWNA